MTAPASRQTSLTAVTTAESDGELLHLYAESRSEDAFAEFVQRHISLVHSAALRRTGGKAHAAADVTQQVFLAAARHARSLARHPRLTGWLYAATRNAAFNLMRDDHRRRQREREAQAACELLAEPAPEAEWGRLRPVLDSAMDELSEQDREAVLQRFFEGRTLADIGTHLQLSENAARMRVERALEKLRVRLARRGLTSTSAALGALLASEASAVVPAGLAATVTGAAVAGTSMVGGGAAALSFWNLMSTTKVVTGAAVMLGLAGVGTAIFEVRASRRAEEARAAAFRERDETRVQIAAMAKLADASAQDLVVATARVASLEDELQTIRKQAARTVVSSAVSENNMPAPRPTEAEVQEQKLQLHHRYDPFLLGQRGLTPAQADRFVTLKLEQAKIREDLQASVRQAGVTGGTRAVEELRTKLYAPVTQEMRELLGEDGYRAYYDSEITSGAHLSYIMPMRSAFQTANVPLSAAQEERLVRIIIANNHPERVNPTDLGTRSRIEWDSVAAEANAVLSPAQLAVFQELASRKKSLPR